MNAVSSPLVAFSLALSLLYLGSTPSSKGEDLRFNRDIRPIISNHCFACHGPDKSHRKADLRLDTFEGATVDLGGYAAIVPGNPDASELIRRIASTDHGEVMPPPEMKEPVSESDQQILRRWIAQGAAWEDHWVYLPPRSQGSMGIDYWIRKPLTERGRDFSPRADKRTLARRLSFDLTGLPPSLEQVQAFEADDRPEAYESLVNSLLSSPAHAERLTVFWLDLVRYADTSGYHGDQHRDAAPYRDYVIESFRSNKPFNQFTVEQLAGDLLKNPSLEQRIASGYNRLLQTTEEGGAQPMEYRAKYASDRVRNVSSVWMGLTLGCAECHDHKFDPLSARDFYQMAAFFADIDEPAVGRHEANLNLPTSEQAQQLDLLDRELAKAEATLARDPKSESHQRHVEELKKRQGKLLAEVSKTLVVSTLKEPRVTRVLNRGNWQDESGEIVEPDVPHVFGTIRRTDERADRLDLAQWLVSENNPLTARVFVNQMWKLFFGEGIARTVDDFGSQGEWPTHPELLDELAIDFVSSGWDVRALIRRIVLSEVYQQSSRVSPELREVDPYNRWLARQSRFRLEAEMIRDNALAVSGLLVQETGGISVKPYQPPGYWDQLNFPKRSYENDQGADQYRRGLYTYWCRTFLHPSLIAFDAPTREECTAKRTRSNTPLQALVLLNDPTYVEAARALGERLYDWHTEHTDSKTALTKGFEMVLSREPRPEELTVLVNFFHEQADRYRDDESAAKELLTVGQLPFPNDRSASVLAAWTSVSRALLNLHETITRY